MVDLSHSWVRRVYFKMLVLHKLIYRLINVFHIKIWEVCFEEWINWLQNLYESAKDGDYSNTVMKNNNKYGVLLLPDVRTHHRLLWSRQCRMSTHTGKWVKSQSREPRRVLQQTTEFQQTHQTMQQAKWNLLNKWCWNHATFMHPKVDFTS